MGGGAGRRWGRAAGGPARPACSAGWAGGRPRGRGALGPRAAERVPAGRVLSAQPACLCLLRLRFLVGSQLARTCSEVGGTAVERKVHTGD